MNATYRKALSSLSDLIWKKRNDKVDLTCYHCYESMPEHAAIAVQFAGKERLVCCHGCRAVLQTIESSHMSQEYLNLRQTRQAST